MPDVGDLIDGDEDEREAMTKGLKARVWDFRETGPKMVRPKRKPVYLRMFRSF